MRTLAQLNRVQPGVHIASVTASQSADHVLVTIGCSSGKGEFRRGTSHVSMQTCVYDLRLFRDGQLVPQWPEPATEPNVGTQEMTSAADLLHWRCAARIDLDERGQARKTFAVRLPHRADVEDMEFTAYAFNEDRVKSATASVTYRAPKQLGTSKPAPT